jgi:hypothetical protein
MSKPELSVVLPSIRPHKLFGVYESIKNASVNTSFELIVVGPYALPEELQGLDNVKFIKDHGSPVRASNIGASYAQGKILTWIADDGFMLENSVDEHLKILYSKGDDTRNVIISKYYENQIGPINGEPFDPSRNDHRNYVIENAPTDYPTLQEKYYKINNADCTRSPYIPDDWWIFNVAFLYREFFEYLGGWDCQYEGTAMAHTDLAVRAQFYGANIIMPDLIRDVADWHPGATGDHLPIFLCQTQHDEPLIQSRYRDPNWALKVKMRLDLDNWKEAPSVWKRRFKDEI